MSLRLALIFAMGVLSSSAATLPLRFEANAGQWTRDVRFSARASGYQLFLTPRQAVVAFVRMLQQRGGSVPQAVAR